MKNAPDLHFVIAARGAMCYSPALPQKESCVHTMGIPFESLGLKEELLRAVADLGFQETMPIQAEAIPHLIKSEIPDFVGLAQTGTGKTCAYGLPILQRIDPAIPAPQALILSPTRELCLQIADETTKFAARMPGTNVVAVYGGASIEGQIRQIRRGAHVIAATPGRLLDLLGRGAFDLSQVAILVLDEADEMLDMGFQDELNDILEQIPETAKTWLFSATMPPGVAKIAANYLRDPIEVTVGNRNETAANITHQLYRVQERKRYESIRRIIDYTPEMFGLVFCRTRSDTQELSEQLMHDGCYAEALHGDLSQAQRDAVMRKFRSHTVRILVATDVAARGLDVDDVTHVIHYHLPDDPAVYTHRSGRTARAGKSGHSIVLAGPRDTRKLGDIERHCRLTFEACPIPGADAIQQRHIQALLDGLLQATPQDRPIIARELPVALTALESLTKEDLLARLLDLRLRPLIDQYAGAPDLNPPPRGERPERRHPRDTPPGGDRTPFNRDRDAGREMQRIMINVGRLDHIRQGAIVRVACEASGIDSSDIGAIDIKREFSFFDVDKRVAHQVLTRLPGAEIDGRRLEARPVDSDRPLRSATYAERGAPFEKKPYRKGSKPPRDSKGGPKFGKKTAEKPFYKKIKKNPPEK